LTSGVHWLVGWPGGLKLNDNLAMFLSKIFVFAIDQWGGRF
jgi:phosphatidylinositol N-acetylglucosaminyltransferase subunit Q